VHVQRASGGAPVALHPAPALLLLLRRYTVCLDVCLLLHHLICVGSIALLDLQVMALRVLALSSPRGVVVSCAHTSLRAPLLTTPAHGSRHFTNRPRFPNHAFCASAPQPSGTTSRRHHRAHALPDNDQHPSIPGEEVQWVLKLKDGLEKKECEKIAGFIHDHINRKEVSNAKVPIPLSLLQG
jgi:hypothetical protein